MLGTSSSGLASLAFLGLSSGTGEQLSQLLFLLSISCGIAIVITSLSIKVIKRILL